MASRHVRLPRPADAKHHEARTRRSLRNTLISTPRRRVKAATTVTTTATAVTAAATHGKPQQLPCLISFSLSRVMKLHAAMSAVTSRRYTHPPTTTTTKAAAAARRRRRQPFVFTGCVMGNPTTTSWLPFPMLCTSGSVSLIPSCLLLARSKLSE